MYKLVNRRSFLMSNVGSSWWTCAYEAVSNYLSL